MNSWTRPNGMVTQFDWYAVNAGADALGLKEIHHIGAGATAGTTVSKFGYSYDLSGRIKSWSRQIDPAPANKKDWAMSYSRAGELTGVVEKNASSVETSRKSWSYDPAGNWYATGDSTSTTHRTHDSMNRLNQIGGSGKTVVEGTLNEAATVSVSGQAAQVASVPGTNDFNFRKEIPVTEGNNNFQITATDRTGNPRTQNYSVNVGAAQKTYEYDSNGNLLREKDPVGTVIRSFEWDGADRIKAVNWGSQRVEWTYNGLGQRVLETVNGVASKRFLWDGIELLLEKDPTHTITKKFYGDGEQRIGGSDAGNYFYTRDHLGSVREVVKQDGTLQARYDYDAYGKRSAIFQDAAYLGGCSFGYTGHITLNSLAVGQSELLLTLFRVYDSDLGRWLSADPIGERGGLNLYRYVNGSPLISWDPLGLYEPSMAYKIGGGWLANGLANRMQLYEISKELDDAAAKNCISGNLLRGVLLNETATRLGGGNIEGLISWGREEFGGGFGTYGPAQLGPAARKDAGLSRWDAMTLSGAIKGAANWLGKERCRLKNEGIKNPSNAQIASRYNNGGIRSGKISTYGKRVEWIIKNTYTVMR